MVMGGVVRVAVLLCAALSVTVGVVMALGAGVQSNLIALETVTDRDLNIVLLDVDRRISHRLYNDRSQDTSPFWSVDGRTLGYVSAVESGVGARIVIRLFDLDSGKGRDVRINQAGVDAIYDPVFLADGRIMFGDVVPGFFEESRLPHILQADGSVTEIHRTDPIAAGYIALDRSLRNSMLPSPDGNRLLQVIHVDGHWVMTVSDDAGMRTLQQVSPLTVQPRARMVWAPDGRRIAYLDQIDGQLSLVVLDLATNHMQIFDTFTALDLAWAP